jgi:O-6-methylguanine DNA methyltransferase
MVIRHTLLLTVVGPLLAVAGEQGLLRLLFLHEAYQYRTRIQAVLEQLGMRSRAAEAGRTANDTDEPLRIDVHQDDTWFAPLIQELGEYFCGRRKTFTTPVDLRGTAFQLRVWRQLQAIPCGKLRSYRQIAAAVGKPGAARAVGQAIGANPVPILVPCHRVIGADGDLVGFGGGMTLKAMLLRLEGHTLGKRPRVIAPRLF